MTNTDAATRLDITNPTDAERTALAETTRATRAAILDQTYDSLDNRRARHARRIAVGNYYGDKHAEAEDRAAVAVLTELLTALGTVLDLPGTVVIKSVTRQDAHAHMLTVEAECDGVPCGVEFPEGDPKCLIGWWTEGNPKVAAARANTVCDHIARNPACVANPANPVPREYTRR